MKNLITWTIGKSSNGALNLVPAESFFMACCHLHHSSEELRLLQDGVVPESSSVVPRRRSSSARRPRSPVRRECRRGAGLPRLNFRPLQGGLNGGVAQERCSGTTSHGGARSGPGAAAVRRGAWCGRGWGATSDPPPAAPSVREK
jgi:hypothetical protein